MHGVIHAANYTHIHNMLGFHFIIFKKKRRALVKTVVRLMHEHAPIMISTYVCVFRDHHHHYRYNFFFFSLYFNANFTICCVFYTLVPE